eukprot:g20422.t1
MVDVNRGKEIKKKPIVPIDLEQLRKQACKVLAGGAGNPDSDDDSPSTSSRSSSSEDDEEEACYKNGVADMFGEKSMVKVPLLKDRGFNLRYTPAANTANLYWRDGKKKVERAKRNNKSGTTMMDPEKYTGWHIKYQQNKKQVNKYIGLKKYLPRNPNEKPEKAEMERREAMMKSMGDAKIARGLLMGFASERTRFKLANKIVGVCFNKYAQKNGRITRRYFGRIHTGKKKPSAKNKKGYTEIEQTCTGTIRILGQRRAFQKCKIWRKKKERARDAKKVIKKHRIREKTWSRRCDGDLCRMLDLRYAARAILLRENFAKETGSNKGLAGDLLQAHAAQELYARGWKYLVRAEKWYVKLEAEVEVVSLVKRTCADALEEPGVGCDSASDDERESTRTFITEEKVFSWDVFEWKKVEVYELPMGAATFEEVPFLEEEATRIISLPEN